MDSSDLEVSSSEKPSDVGRLSCNLNFNEAKHEMCVIIQGEDDITRME
jgi:hypothetical protein